MRTSSPNEDLNSELRSSLKTATKVFYKTGLCWSCGLEDLYEVLVEDRFYRTALRITHRHFPSSGDGVVDNEEFEYVLSEFGLSEKVARQAFTIFTEVRICTARTSLHRKCTRYFRSSRGGLELR